MVIKSIFYFFIEGPNDKAFFQKIFHPILIKKYNFVKYILWSSQKKDFLKALIKQIEKNKYEDYIFISDFDLNRANCYPHKKELLIARMPFINKIKILIVKAEIESWYSAGLSREDQHYFNLHNLPFYTETITKEIFEKEIAYNFSPKTYLFELILDKYSIEIAQQRNESFKYVQTRIKNLINEQNLK